MWVEAVFKRFGALARVSIGRTSPSNCAGQSGSHLRGFLPPMDFGG